VFIGHHHTDMTTFTLAKQITPQTRQEIRFTVFNSNVNDPKAVARQAWQTSLNTGEMVEQSGFIHDFIGNNRNLYRNLIKQGWMQLPQTWQASSKKMTFSKKAPAASALTTFPGHALPICFISTPLAGNLIWHSTKAATYGQHLMARAT
jgi:hypothetical protein